MERRVNKKSSRNGGRVRSIVHAGDRGTIGTLADYGPRLLCVRYRYDAKRKIKMKTVELILYERYWNPPQKKKTGAQHAHT